MEFILSAKDSALADAFDIAADGLDNVTVFRGSIFDVEADAYVSPANSFGFMDGGLDAWFVWRFGERIQDNVRMSILKYWQGELPVGCSEIVETNDCDVPFVIVAPTMRVPMILGKDSINAYLAMRAVIMCCRNGSFRDGEHIGHPVSGRVKRIAVPGLGTGVGKVPFDLASFQMCEAIRLHQSGRHFLPKSWSQASEDHLALLRQKPRNMQRD